MITRKRIKTLLTFAVVAMAALGLTTASAYNSGETYYQDFESPGVIGYSQGSIPDGWVGSNVGYGSDRKGLINKDSGDYTAEEGNNQAFAFRYTNSGMTSAVGTLGVLEEGEYTVIFQVATDTNPAGTAYTAELVAFDAAHDNVARENCQAARPGVILATAGGNATTNHMGDTVSFSYIAEAGDASLGKDLGIRFLGATSSAIIDNVQFFSPVIGPKTYSPKNGESITMPIVDLRWTNMDPTDPNDSVYVDVWFGTVSGALDQNLVTPIEANADANAVLDIDVSAQGIFYWRVDTYINGLDHINEPNRIVGPEVSFSYVDEPPTHVTAGGDMITWTGEPVPVVGTVYGDDGMSPVDVLWSALNPNPNIAITYDPADNVEATSITFTKVTAMAPFVQDGSFEYNLLNDNQSTSTPNPYWIDGYYDLSENPNVWVVGSSGAGVMNPNSTRFGGIAYDGENVMYVNITQGDDSGFFQMINANLAANTQYELSAQVGSTTGLSAGYRIELVAGGVVLDTVTGASPTTANTWETTTLSFTSDASPAQLGEQLEVRIIAKPFAGADIYLYFDDVKLTVGGAATTLSPPPTGLTQFAMTFSATDEANPAVTDVMVIDIYDDACEMAKVVDPDGRHITDFDGNCITNLDDYAVMAAAWLVDYTPTAPFVKP